MLSELEIYEDYCRRCKTMWGCEPASIESWQQVGTYLTQEEVKRHVADKFLADLHPDGSNLAGFHGMTNVGDIFSSGRDGKK